MPEVIGYVPGSERIMPTSLDNAEPTHLARYGFALQFLKSQDRVIDCGCGGGYGSKLIAGRCKSIVGVDNSPEAIEHSRKHFRGGNIEYRVADLQSPLPFEDGSFDSAVSFEVVEHLDDPRKFLAELGRVLKDGALLVISTPRKPHGSPYHRHEYTREEFISLLSEFFDVTDTYNQAGTQIGETVSRPAGEKLNYVAICKKRDLT